MEPDWLQKEERIRALDEICANCGCTYGAHCASGYYSEVYKKCIPYNYCPGHEGRMDWDKGPGLPLKLLGNLKENKMVTERTLKRWRRDALKKTEKFDPEFYAGTAPGIAAAYQECLKRILCMTQELLDAHLVRSGQVSKEKEEK